MGPRERRAGKVGRQEREFVFHQVGVLGLVSDEPDEAGAEHGVGGGDESGPEGFGGGEGVADFGGEGGGHFGGFGGEGGEELVVGPGHAGVVEEGGELRLTGVREEKIDRGSAGVFGSWVGRHLAGCGDGGNDRGVIEVGEGSIPAVSWLRRSRR